MADIKQIFKELQDLGAINPDRKLIKVPYWSNADCGMIWCFIDADKESFGRWFSRKLHEIHPALGLVNGFYYIQEDVDKLSDNSITWMLLHEEGHARYILDHLDWNDKYIKTIRNETFEDRHAGECRADDYATRMISIHYPDVDVTSTMKDSHEVWNEIFRTKKILKLLAKFERFLYKRKYGKEIFHPEPEDRYARVEQLKKMHKCVGSWNDI